MFNALLPSRFVAGKCDEHSATLTHVEYKDVHYFVSGIFVYCIKMLYSTKFTFSVVASRETTGKFDHTIDARRQSGPRWRD